MKAVKDFLLSHHVQGSPLLVGFSGGPDSTALLHALLECRRFFPLEIEAAHVDHGWRAESAAEAAILSAHCKEINVPLHTCRLTGGCKGEETAREARFSFFSNLCQKGYQAVLLGHQRDDQAETVLKRILEGAHPLSLGGIEPIQEWKGMQIWRPLLSVPKEEILIWLEKKQLKFFNDVTNADPRFLRGRMRSVIFPELEEKFGKNVAANLSYFGSHAQELADYLSRKTARLWQAAKGGLMDFEPFFPIERLELKTFLKQWVESQDAFLSRVALEDLVRLVEEGRGRSKIVSGQTEIEIHRRVVAIKNHP